MADSAPGVVTLSALAALRAGECERATKLLTEPAKR
jgi:hypothetical protein